MPRHRKDKDLLLFNDNPPTRALQLSLHVHANQLLPLAMDRTTPNPRSNVGQV